MNWLPFKKCFTAKDICLMLLQQQEQHQQEKLLVSAPHKREETHAVRSQTSSTTFTFNFTFSAPVDIARHYYTNYIRLTQFYYTLFFLLHNTLTLFIIPHFNFYLFAISSLFFCGNVVVVYYSIIKKKDFCCGSALLHYFNFIFFVSFGFRSNGVLFCFLRSSSRTFGIFKSTKKNFRLQAPYYVIGLCSAQC